MAATTGYERFTILRRAADLMAEKAEDLARTLSAEEGKILAEARLEVDRAVQTIELSGEEAKRLTAEVLPLDGGKDVRNKLGFTLRVPCGVVAAIAPFNFPLNLVCHKVGPALAAGNSVILKPATDTPLLSLKLVEFCSRPASLLSPFPASREAAPPSGRGSAPIPGVARSRFTGSREVGEKICSVAGIKKVTMELGSNCPLIVLPDADIDQVAQATVTSGFANAGQVCISAQRVIVHEKVHTDFVDALTPKVEGLLAGNQLAEGTQVGPMVRAGEARRVTVWIDEALDEGARLVCGGQRDGALVQPALLDNTSSEMRVNREELFGPAVAVSTVANIDEAIAAANDSEYGLSAGVFTRDIDAAVRFAREVDSGNIHVNWGPLWRADLMPYGGLKGSGLGKEGPKYAVQEMTELKAVVIHAKA